MEVCCVLRAAAGRRGFGFTSQIWSYLHQPALGRYHWVRTEIVGRVMADWVARPTGNDPEKKAVCVLASSPLY